MRGDEGVRCRVEVVEEVALARSGRRISEKTVVEAHLRGVRVLGRNPVQVALDLDAVGARRAGLGVGQVGAMHGDDLAVLVLVAAGAFDDVAVFEACLVAGEEAAEALFRHFLEVFAFDPQFAAEGHDARAQFGVQRVVGDGAVLELAVGIVVDDQLDRLQHGHAALGVQLQLGAQHGLQLAHIHEVVSLGDAGLFHEVEDARRRVAAAAETGEGRHTGVVPTVY